MGTETVTAKCSK